MSAAHFARKSYNRNTEQLFLFAAPDVLFLIVLIWPVALVTLHSKLSQEAKGS